jgi:digeranylgeranylglycerophospholipid reductase
MRGWTFIVARNFAGATEMTEFDVVVAGGGPGGLAFAETAARSGCSVRVIEQSKEIGSPTRTTGGSFVEDLRALGIPEHLYHPIRTCRFLSPGNCARYDYEEPTLCVMDVRGVFQFLAERAIDAGVRISLATSAVEPLIEEGRVCGVRAKSATGPDYAIRSKILVDATGYRASMLKQSGTHPGYKRFGVGSEYDLYAPNCSQQEGVLIVGSQVAPAGYAWIFPWGKNRVRVGVGIIHSDSDAHPDAYLDRLVEGADRFGVNLKNAQPVEYHYGLIPSEGMGDPFVGDGIMAVGDAAGQAPALVGEGIRWAIKAGRMAGTVAARAVKAADFSKEFLGQYQKQWASAFGKNLRIAYEINKRISKFGDDDWDRKTELLKSMTPRQFGEALQSNFAAAWALKFAWSHPRLVAGVLSTK